MTLYHRRSQIRNAQKKQGQIMVRHQILMGLLLLPKLMGLLLLLKPMGDLLMRLLKLLKLMGLLKLMRLLASMFQKQP